MLSKKVFFISQAEAERLEPVPGAAMMGAAWNSEIILR